MTRERTADAARGTIDGYHWAEDWAAGLGVSDVVRELQARFVGLRAVCSSWDSAMLDATSSGLSGWEMRSGQAVSPVIGADLAKEWPASSCGWDEWYFFENVPVFDRIHAFCNWGGLSLANAAELEELDAGFSLGGQLERYRPQLVLGDGRRVFLLGRDKTTVSEFVDVCGRRRTTRCS